MSSARSGSRLVALGLALALSLTVVPAASAQPVIQSPSAETSGDGLFEWVLAPVRLLLTRMFGGSDELGSAGARGAVRGVTAGSETPRSMPGVYRGEAGSN